ncbi:LysR family transcriptional regulator [Bradyrhizobium sp. WD16]|uniref:LysR family transcriptional regulator n=1 Tax=Bradyrhizobium sp. WD16 TaxID=1521768 RepID=UPI0020A38C1E|nr:LysR family transcriptional regulator [Bradyrhizobium sp. WD16]UTD27630.1 LysR family transcriptional regulator [Bradyrhizobium sp. WD16]
MLIRHLSYFVALADARHFARAAEICNVTQPALSAAIRKLEDDLNATLIVRGHRYQGLTPDGERALQWGRQILSDYQNLKKGLGSARAGLNGALRLGVIPAAMPGVALISERFTRINPLATIDIRSMTSRAIQLALETYQIDGGLTYLENEPLEHVRRHLLYREHYVFACTCGHPLAARPSIDWAEALAEPLCLLNENMQNRRILNAIAASLGLPVASPVISDSFLAVLAHVSSGRWCSILPHTFSRLLGSAPDLRTIELVNPIETQAIGLVLLDRLPQSPMAAALLDAVGSGDGVAGPIEPPA